MNASQQMENVTVPDTQVQNSDQRTQRQQRIEERRTQRAARSGDSWMGGAILIGLGILFLLNNLNVFYVENWWALFILLPAVGAFTTAWKTYRQERLLSSPVRANLIGGTILTLVAAMFLFNLDWMIFGPILLILAGVGLAINALLPE
jgi:hypothetical protein